MILERHALAARSDLFEDIFGFRVRLNEDTSARGPRALRTSCPISTLHAPRILHQSRVELAGIQPAGA